ncbi:tyrosine aminotransferase-like isoform X1 [Lutzomyia longipalpis]|uniref:tyrosine aminotransferase-like isoform X1 n=1 Tax=Lutzomyia longipalpis TaxID=7200 RepID=UPI00248352E1|nr:tyrosine aminotransferase-like isoform X1 [Lutzomyia longipalpis]
MSVSAQNGTKVDNEANGVHGKKRREWRVEVSRRARQTYNPLRTIIEFMDIKPNPKKSLIPLSIGDPTVFGNLKACPEIQNAVIQAASDHSNNGYSQLIGSKAAREAIANHMNRAQHSITPDDVYIVNGCSGAVEMSIVALANPGQNILCPRPGYSIFQTVTQALDIEMRQYNLLPDQKWEADLKQMESLIDENTVAIVVINPSNPCGSVFSRSHLEDVIALAEKYFLPIIADEIYEHIVFPGKKFYSLAPLSKNVPVLQCGGVSKRYLAPGWRLGWIVINDRGGVLKDVKDGLAKLSGVPLCANTVIQGALPAILKNTPQSFYDEVNGKLHVNIPKKKLRKPETNKKKFFFQRTATVAFEMLSEIEGMKPVMPEGAMYMMVGIDLTLFPEFKDGLAFIKALVEEESVFGLPGECFCYPNYIRIVITIPEEKMREACERIGVFCANHRSNTAVDHADSDDPPCK